MSGVTVNLRTDSETLRSEDGALDKGEVRRVILAALDVLDTVTGLHIAPAQIPLWDCNGNRVGDLIASEGPGRVVEMRETR